jgi:hypothetical protein
MDVWQLKPAENCRFSPKMNGDGFCGKNVEAKRHGFKGKHIGSAKKGDSRDKIGDFDQLRGFTSKDGGMVGVFNPP